MKKGLLFAGLGLVVSMLGLSLASQASVSAAKSSSCTTSQFKNWKSNWAASLKQERQRVGLPAKASGLCEQWKAAANANKQTERAKAAREAKSATKFVKRLSKRSPTSLEEFARKFYALPNSEKIFITKYGAGFAQDSWINMASTQTVISCESGHDPNKVSYKPGARNIYYNGLYQFHKDTWDGSGEWARQMSNSSNYDWMNAPDWAQHYAAYRKWVESGGTFAKHWGNTYDGC